MQTMREPGRKVRPVESRPANCGTDSVERAEEQSRSDPSLPALFGHRVHALQRTRGGPGSDQRFSATPAGETTGESPARESALATAHATHTTEARHAAKTRKAAAAHATHAAEPAALAELLH